jgi:hypothetical protein
MHTMRHAMTAAALASVLALTGCGSKDQAGSAQGAAPSRPTGVPGGFDPAQLKQVRSCLKAAGLADRLPKDLPTGVPSGMPSGGATGSPPSGFPSDLPSGGPPSGGFGALQSSDVQQALKACGISLQPPVSAGSS